ncbi:hypothetical protein EKH57_02170 [Halorubrum sp. BOL3-1]|nr:hypothetical protein EKH57_02170 [Halorubrum sp. BOL3-1]
MKHLPTGEIKEAAPKVDLSGIVEREAIRAETIDGDVELGRAADRKTLSENFIPAFGERNITEHVRNSFAQ